jgi:hypothetical protein
VFTKDDFLIDNDDGLEEYNNHLDTNEASEALPLFSSDYNPNKEIFVVPTQEGADKDDQWNGSIGDATMEHIYSMSHRLLEMEHYIHMSNGNIFRIESDVSGNDFDGSKKAAKDITLVMTAKDKNLTVEKKEALYNFLLEEVEENKKRIEDKEDALEHPAISFEDWENIPQMMNHVDIPSPPKPLWIFAGNSKQKFYDNFPEGHPDEKNINAFINMVNNIDWDFWTKETAERCIAWLHHENRNNPKTGLPIPRNWEIFTCVDHLTDFCKNISREENPVNPDEAMQLALTKIDQDWGKIVYSKTMKQFMDTKPMQELLKFYSEFKPKQENGELVWGKLGKVGKTFYGLGDQVTAAHWNAYKRMKANLAPRILLGKIDLNRAKFNELVDFFRMNKNDIQTSEKLAKNIFFNRPFMKLEELVEKNYLKIEEISGNKENFVQISMLRNATKKSIINKSNFELSSKIQEIVETQKQNPKLMTDENWQGVYQYYRLCKELLNNKLGANK